jgi:hypothetical protein
MCVLYAALINQSINLSVYSGRVEFRFGKKKKKKKRGVDSSCRKLAEQSERALFLINAVLQ